MQAKDNPGGPRALFRENRERKEGCFDVKMYPNKNIKIHCEAVMIIVKNKL